MDNSEFQQRAKNVVRNLADQGPDSEFVPKVFDDGEVESFNEWYRRVFRKTDTPPEDSD